MHPYTLTLSLSDLTPDYIKKTYLAGLRLLDDNNQEMADEWYTTHIANAIAWLEDVTNVDILKRVNVKETHDYHVNDYIQYAFIQLFRIPALSVQAVRAVYPTGQLMQVFPNPWVKLETHHSQIQLVPTAGTLSQVIIGQGGDYLPLVFGSLNYLPQLWEVDYTSGFDPEAVPRMIIEAICKRACIEMLQIMADTIAPLGQTSQSLSIDGMSQSRSFALPAFKARIDKYSADLGLPPAVGTNNLLSQIRNTYLGINLASV